MQWQSDKAEIQRISEACSMIVIEQHKNINNPHPITFVRMVFKADRGSPPAIVSILAQVLNSYRL